MTIFLKGVKKVRKRESLSVVLVRESMSEELTRVYDVEVRWREYFV